MSGLPKVHGEFGVVMDPAVRFAESGNCILSLRLIAKKRVRDSNGNWTDGATPLFIDCTVFGKTAEHLADSIGKGDSVVVDGVLEQQEWADKETGEKRSKVCIIADEVGVSTKWGTAKTPRVTGESESGPSQGANDDGPPF
jgi:single-strand DNA-binding protein